MRFLSGIFRPRILSAGVAHLKAQRHSLSTIPGFIMSTDMEPAKCEQKLSGADFRIYNRMSEHMNSFHDGFRATWRMLYSAASSGKRPSGMSIRQFIDSGEQFIHHLDIHHSIEEQYIFPILAQRMPAFKKELELLTQHKQIHKGMEAMSTYLGKCKSGEEDFRMEALQKIMDGFGEVLWTHLDQEVRELGAENMRKYWTRMEMTKMPL